ncbi:hydrogenase maturation protease [Mycobacterium shigaense]|uniref:Peptidase M52 n=1 Tax=Mycobacterium shigaense TaxID=722731 RepID=A0A1Z4EJ64_9MYCO|nr:hydrogenase maturation protease [Mycobacterium shigaense]PRI13843.1 hypothetical protein B2J96_19610 [Mycobacterium shigaense]BAX92997.1 peptidase M52 [Mycobacterium shigaense]
MSKDAPTIPADMVVVGLGNAYRKDDAVGVIAAAAIRELVSPHVRVVTDISDSTLLLDAWRDAEVAVVIDAARGASPMPGEVRRWTVADLTNMPKGWTSHSIDLARTHALAQILAQAPTAMVVFAVEVVDTGHGVGLTAAVADAVPEVVGLVLAEINDRRTTTRRSPHSASR